MNRKAPIVISVIALHVAVLWAMQTGLMRRVVEVVMPTEIVVEIMSPAAPMPSPKPVQQPQAKAQTKPVTPKPALPAPAPTATAQPTLSPLAIAPSATAPEPSATAPTAVTAASTATSANTGSKVNAPPAPAKVELPSNNADYLNNPKPPYPPLSKRLGEQGKVVVRVWIGIDGQASQASVKSSSGFDRLDQAALTTVLEWRYVPGKRGGVPEAMWFDVPLNWVLQ
jgi:protein TonB